VAAAEAHLRSRGVSAGDIDSALAASHDYIEDQSSDDKQPRLFRANLVTRYEFREGRLRGLGVGGSVRWSHGGVRDPGGLFITGQLVIPERQNADEFVVSPFLKYAAKVGKVRWTAQLNVDNAFNNVTNQGRIARYPRYTEPRLVTLTNYFRF
jgi:outer membrane receptor for ferric coprogen and ferric-rhodotorulic acid